MERPSYPSPRRYLAGMNTIRSFFLTTVILTTAAASAQAPRYIEIAVSDTLYLQPTSITYKVQAGEDHSFMGMQMPSFGNDSASTVPLDDVLEKLKAAKFQAQRVQNANYELKGKPADALEITVKDRAELERLLQMLRPIPGISGSISSVQHAAPAPAQGTFYTDLLAKARREAGAIAAASGLKLGPVISVGERPTAADSYLDMMRQIMKSYTFKTMVGDVSDEMVEPYVRTLLIRFEAN